MNLLQKHEEASPEDPSPVEKQYSYAQVNTRMMAAMTTFRVNAV